MDVLHAYDQVASRRDLPTMRPGGFTVETETLTEPEAVLAALRGLTPTQGWVQFQSTQTAFFDGLPDPEPGWGAPLAAEAVGADGGSVVLGPDGAGGWRLSIYRHEGAGDCLSDEVAQIAHDPKTGRLKYRRYWLHDPRQGYVQVCACFIGFE